MREFAEQEIVIPDGPFEGRKFSCDRQPYTRLWFDAIDSGRWNRHAATGPVQSGKTLSAFIAPLMFHLFETGDNVVCGVPDKNVIADKWSKDILPAIKRSRYHDLLPTSGLGSKGGQTDSVTFKNGKTLRFMTGRGKDESRSAYTARVVVITEVDKMDVPSAASRETDPIRQLEARTKAYGSRKRIYLECTVSTDEGRIWTEYTGGTQSRIACRCPCCRDYVSPEREDFSYGQAETEGQAERQAAFFCPSCGERWTDAQRLQANLEAVLVHRGQEIDADGQVHGDPPDVKTLGFRWSAANNLFVPPGEIGIEEFRAKHREDESSDKGLLQFTWVRPYKPDREDLTGLRVADITARTVDGLPRGMVPADAWRLVFTVDVRKRELHWTFVAWRHDGSGHVVEYGIEPVAGDTMAEEIAIRDALRKLRDERVKVGWKTAAGATVRPGLCLVDSGYKADVIYAFVAESGAAWTATKGFGEETLRQGYSRPKSTGATVEWIGEECHVSILPSGARLLEVNADHWKSHLHARLSTPIGLPGSLALFALGDGYTHDTFARHLTSERRVQEFVPDKGVVIKWVRERKANHWLDCGALACVGAHALGVKLVPMPKQPEPKRELEAPMLTMPDGRQFLITDRA